MTSQGNTPVAWPVTIRFTITIGAITGFLALVLTVLYYNKYSDERARNTIDFGAKAIGIAAGVTSAFFVGESIKRNLEDKKLDRQQVLEQVKINRALNYIAEWNNPSRNSNKQDIVEKLKDKIKEAEKQSPANYPAFVNTILDDDKQLTESLRNLLNFLEDMAASVNRQLVDEEILKDYFEEIVKRFYLVFSSWIDIQRQGRDRENSYRNLQHLNQTWSRRRQP